MKTHAYLLSIVVLLSAALLSCGKNEPPAIITNDFTYSGTPLAWQPIYFHTSAGTKARYLWDFGDGFTSTVADPKHVYADNRTYTVTLTINNDPAHTIKKPLQIFNDPLYTHQIAGARLWSHLSTVNFSSGDHIVTGHPDTAFAIAYIDPLTVAAGKDTLRYMDYNHSDTMLIFSKYQETNIPGRPNRWLIYFDRVSDSIHYQYTPAGSAGGQGYDDYYTK